MKGNLNLLVGVANKLALRLSLQEAASFQRQPMPNDQSISLEGSDSEAEQKNVQVLTLSKTAMEIVHQAFMIDQLYHHRFVRNAEHNTIAPSSNIKHFPIKRGQHHNAMLYANQVYQEFPQIYKKVLSELNISEAAFSKWRRKMHRAEKSQQLAASLKKLPSIRYQQMQKMAMDIYANQFFRASETWCLNFLHKHHLLNLLSTQEEKSRRNVKLEQE